ncbi:MAG: OmpA family protein [Gammaproteobacteria bacterium]|nr:OmpA family protein [Gammaproteobacteria bacterium]
MTEIRAAPPAGLAYARNLAGGLSFLVQFRHDSHRVAPHFAEQLRGLARVLEPVSGLHVQVDGFADQRGGTPYNEALSFHRARAVADVMREAGWSAERIHVRAHGEGRPLVPEGDYAGYPFDRRALITFTAGGTGR